MKAVLCQLTSRDNDSVALPAPYSCSDFPIFVRLPLSVVRFVLQQTPLAVAAGRAASSWQTRENLCDTDRRGLPVNESLSVVWVAITLWVYRESAVRELCEGEKGGGGRSRRRRTRSRTRRVLRLRVRKLYMYLPWALQQQPTPCVRPRSRPLVFLTGAHFDAWERALPAQAARSSWSLAADFS